MADADSPQRAAGAAAKPRTGAAAKPRTGTAAKPRTGTGTAAEPGADAAAEPRADAVGEPGTGGGARGRAGLKIHHLRPAPGAHTARTRVGRGEAGKGKTAGRGTKGTKARGQVAPGFEGGQMPLQRRVPKLRGFSNLRFKTTYQVVNTGRLAELYPQGGDVTPEDLVAKGAVRAGNLVKVLGTGDADVTLRVTAHAFSAAAREKITAAGGTVTEL
jgi:large subunit ribosomal protein L15